MVGGLAHFQMLSVDQAAKVMKGCGGGRDIEDFVEGLNQPTYRAMRVDGVRVHAWSSLAAKPPGGVTPAAKPPSRGRG